VVEIGELRGLKCIECFTE